MYSKNDYRYYLENQLMHSDDFLAHYGVKGMKWHKHKYSSRDYIDDAKENVEALRENFRDNTHGVNGSNTKYNIKQLGKNLGNAVGAKLEETAFGAKKKINNKKRKVRPKHLATLTSIGAYDVAIQGKTHSTPELVRKEKKRKATWNTGTANYNGRTRTRIEKNRQKKKVRYNVLGEPIK